MFVLFVVICFRTPFDTYCSSAQPRISAALCTKLASLEEKNSTSVLDERQDSPLYYFAFIPAISSWTYLNDQQGRTPKRTTDVMSIDRLLGDRFFGACLSFLFLLLFFPCSLRSSTHIVFLSTFILARSPNANLSLLVSLASPPPPSLLSGYLFRRLFASSYSYTLFLSSWC